MRKDILLLLICLPLLVSCTKLDELFGKDDRIKAGTKTTAVTDDGQLYNMGFDLWCHDDDGDVVLYDSLATDDQKRVWGSANASTASFGKPTCTPDSVMVAVEGLGKYAVKLKTQLIDALVMAFSAASASFSCPNRRRSRMKASCPARQVSSRRRRLGDRPCHSRRPR